jgi:hypothetical protein
MNTKIVIALVVGVAIGAWLSTNGAVVLPQKAEGADIRLVLECHGIEGKLGALIGNFELIDEYEQYKKDGHSYAWMKDEVKTYYPRVGLVVEGGMVKLGDIAMPKARIANASATRIEFVADKEPNVIPFSRNGIIDRLSGEVEFHDSLVEGGPDMVKLKSQWLFRCKNAQPKF